MVKNYEQNSSKIFETTLLLRYRQMTEKDI